MSLPPFITVLAVAIVGSFSLVQGARGQTPASPRDSTIADSAARQRARPDTSAHHTTPSTPATTLRPMEITARPARQHGYAELGALASTKTSTTLVDLPQAATVVTRQLIDDRSMQSMADVVRYIPGMTIAQGEGNRDQVVIRGNGSSADFFVNGIRDDAQYFRDLYNLDRVEALKGANALLFGRGGGGGALNRITKQPQWQPIRELTLEGGSFDEKRASVDVGQGLGPAVAARLNAVYENSGMFRDNVSLTRYGINPTLTVAPGTKRTQVTLGYEFFSDDRTADRGIPSYQGLPVRTGVATFFGNPDINHARARVNAADATITHEFDSGIRIDNHARFTSYTKRYQNVYPGAVDRSGAAVTLSAYNHSTPRTNLFNQTTLTYDVATGAVRHTLLAGAELGRESSDNVRNTGYFNDSTTSMVTPLADPTIDTPVSFRQSATDADAQTIVTTRSLYLQDHVALSTRWQLVAGVRYDHFGIRYHDTRSNVSLSRSDDMIAPRFGIVFKPAMPVSIYASRSVSYLPGAGDQFSSLSAATQGLRPERFTNYEVGAKWDVARRLALTTALYRLDRTNTRSPDPADPTLMLQTGSQRSSGFELGASGSITPAWTVTGGYSHQDATITSTTTAARTGAAVALVPRNTLTLWNKVQVSHAIGLGLGVAHQSDMFAAVDDQVTLPGYTEVDGALYLTLSSSVRAQMYLENLLDVRYYQSANNNNNITPGSPRAVRVSIMTSF
jgi:catecholate siderophore receptor